MFQALWVKWWNNNKMYLPTWSFNPVRKKDLWIHIMILGSIIKQVTKTERESRALVHAICVGGVKENSPSRYH